MLTYLDLVRLTETAKRVETTTARELYSRELHSREWVYFLTADVLSIR